MSFGHWDSCEKFSLFTGEVKDRGRRRGERERQRQGERGVVPPKWGRTSVAVRFVSLFDLVSFLFFLGPSIVWLLRPKPQVYDTTLTKLVFANESN